jgi:hypothetical protein
LSGHDDIAPEIAFDKVDDFGSRVGGDFVESVDADIDRATVY